MRGLVQAWGGSPVRPHLQLRALLLRRHPHLHRHRAGTSGRRLPGPLPLSGALSRAPPPPVGAYGPTQLWEQRAQPSPQPTKRTGLLAPGRLRPTWGRAAWGRDHGLDGRPAPVSEILQQAPPRVLRRAQGPALGGRAWADQAETRCHCALGNGIPPGNYLSRPTPKASAAPPGRRDPWGGPSLSTRSRRGQPGPWGSPAASPNHVQLCWNPGGPGKPRSKGLSAGGSQ